MVGEVWAGMVLNERAFNRLWGEIWMHEGVKRAMEQPGEQPGSPCDLE